MKVLEKFYGKDLELPVLFEKSFKHINTVKNSYEGKYEARFNDYRPIIIHLKNMSKAKCQEFLYQMN